MKYIDADKLKERIGKLDMESCISEEWTGFYCAIDGILEVIDSFQQEQPEQHTRGYDEACLNEKIAKATKSWKGVDVDKFMDEVRGREPEVDLEKEIRSAWEKCNPVDEGMGVESAYMHIEAFDIIARHFAQWGAEHSGDKKRLVMVRKERIEDHINELNDKYLGGVYSSYDMAKAYAEGNIDGQKWQKEQIMKEAADGEVVKDINNKLVVTAKINLDGFKFGDKVKLIVLKEEEK